MSAEGEGNRARHMGTYRIPLPGSGYARLTVPDDLTEREAKTVSDFLDVLRVHQAKVREQTEATRTVMAARRRAQAEE